MSTRLLHGLRVLDLSTPIGYTCGAFLASLGADVVRVDRTAGDNTLSWRLLRLA